MDISRLIEALSAPSAYPYPVADIEFRQTHISAVFLAGDFVYKVKKPVNPGFLDFSTLEKRRHFCDEEVRLNRRLAPRVYLGVVPIVQTPDGFRLEGDGEAIEWAVKMLRLPDAATFLERMRRDEITVTQVEELARRIALFHQSAETSTRIAGFGSFEKVSRNVLDIFDRAAPQVGTTVAEPVFARARLLAEQALANHRQRIEQRAAQSKTRDCHGDLHLDHFYLFPDRQPPDDLVVIDCIEFSERLRFIDPMADIAFPVMDFTFYGRRDLARAFAEAYFRQGDEDGRSLLPLYTAYRATVRGMVEGLLLAEREATDDDRAAARQRALAHWLLALTELEEPEAKPCLILIAGLPGTGKSTLARGLADAAGFSVIRSDVVRKELAGLPIDGLSSQEAEVEAQRGARSSLAALRPPQPVHAPDARERLYTPEWNERTYAECRRRAEALLFEGKRVIVDATFREEKARRTFLETAVRCGVPGLILLCQADSETTRHHIAQRRGDASDADWNVYLRLAEDWEDFGNTTKNVLHPISTERSPEQAVSNALEVLRIVGLYV